MFTVLFNRHRLSSRFLSSSVCDYRSCGKFKTVGEKATRLILCKSSCDLTDAYQLTLDWGCVVRSYGLGLCVMGYERRVISYKLWVTG